MHFTIVFDGPESVGASYSLCFAPNPCWFLGPTNILALDRSTPDLPANAVRPLLNKVRRDLDAVPVTRCVIVVHPNGYGTETDLARLVADCEAASIVVTSVVRFPG